MSYQMDGLNERLDEADGMTSAQVRSHQLKTSLPPASGRGNVFGHGRPQAGSRVALAPPLEKL